MPLTRMNRFFRNKCWLLPALTAASLWQVWPWLWGRWFGQGGESLYGWIFIGLAIVSTVAVIFPRNDNGDNDSGSIIVALGFLLGFVILYRHLPKLFSAAIAMSALFWSIRAAMPKEKRAGTFSLWPLLVLSLPHSASLQFTFGYPMRLLAAHAAAWTLPGKIRAIGCGITDGTVEVFVDAPCAGAGLLSSSLFLAAGAGLIFGLNWLRSSALLFLGIVLALGANALRAALLYAGASGMLSTPFHEYESITGISCFVMSGCTLALAAYWLGKKQSARSDKTTAPSLRDGCEKCRIVFIALYVFVCLFVASGIWAESKSANTPPPPTENIVWPRTWEGRNLIPVPASPETAYFWRNFPGAFQEFLLVPAMSEANSPIPREERIVLRYVHEATRQLHPAEDCFRGAGFRVTALPLFIDDNGRRWSRFSYEKSGQRGFVRQCVVSVINEDLRDIPDSAVSWPDVSSWYWEVALPGSKTPAPAVAVTIMQEGGVAAECIP